MTTEDVRAELFMFQHRSLGTHGTLRLASLQLPTMRSIGFAIDPRSWDLILRIPDVLDSSFDMFPAFNFNDHSIFEYSCTDNYPKGFKPSGAS